MCHVKPVRGPRLAGRGCSASTLRLIVLAFGLLAASTVGYAQDAWEYTPYRVKVWLALEAVPELPETLRQDIARAVMEQSESAFGATWNAQVSPVPTRFHSEMLYRLDQFPIDDLVAAAKLGKSAQVKKDKASAGAGGSAASGTKATGAAPAGASAPGAPVPAGGPSSANPLGGEAPSPTPAPAPAPMPVDQAPATPGTGCELTQETATATQGSEPTADNSTENRPAAATPETATPVPMPAPAPATIDAPAAAAPVLAPMSEEEETPPAHDPLVVQLREVFAGDKLLVASVRAVPSGWLVQARELDVRSRRWSTMVEMEVGETDALPRSVVAALHQTFQPIVRIDYAKEKTIMVRMRAGGLAVRADEPVAVGEQALLRPWVRHNDRYGEPRPPLGVQSIPYTYLIVQKRDGSRLECEPHTGVKFPITGKNNARTERFALVVKPTQPTTLIRLRTNEKPPQPLSGYDIYAKNPRSEAVELIGRTDWRGTMVLPPSGEFPLRVVYVKNGGSLLARLPTVPGVEAEMVVDLTPDDKRLQAEGFVAGVQAVLTDLVAQRTLYAKRIRTRLGEGKIPEAEKLLEEFKALQTRDDVQKLIDQQQPRITSPHKKVQAKIDKQFEDTRKLLYKFVDPGLLAKLDEEVKQTKEGKGPYAAALGAVDPPK